MTAAAAPAAIAEAILERAAQAWNDGDGAAFGVLFTGETDFVDIRGGHHRGDGAHIGAGHQALFDSIYAGSTVRFRLDVARPVAQDCIMAVATSTLDAPHGPLRGVKQSRLTMLLTPHDRDWRITGFHNTLVAEAS